CLRLNHGIRIVRDALTIANRRTVIIRKPHMVNPSGIGHMNCSCPSCYHDRMEFGCKNPGQCIETAKMLIDNILPKWNPTIGKLDLSQELSLTNDELESNKKPLQTDHIIVFDPNFTLSNMADGFRIFCL
ncbi:hypothetical protein B0H13DRAFT_1625145, partial [Mycena leptocephala]